MSSIRKPKASSKDRSQYKVRNKSTTQMPKIMMIPVILWRTSTFLRAQNKKD